MANFSGQPSIINRFLGFLDADDPTNVPVGLSALVRNCTFEMTSVRTRDGINTTMQGVNKQPITGLIGALYTPETSTEQFFQLPMIFDMAGSLQYENPVGTGRMNAFAYDLMTPPANTQMIACQTYNKVFAAFSTLLEPASGMATIDPKTKKVWPYGMKPFGWTWVKQTPVLVGEMCTPTAPGGNGHTYRCITPGETGANEPVWPLTDAGTIIDGTAEWEEYTAVMANRLPAATPPVLHGFSSGAGFPGGTDVYVILTLLNGVGESAANAPVFITTELAPAETVLIAVGSPGSGQPIWLNELAGAYAVTGVNIYVASVVHGNPAPDITTYKKLNAAPVAFGTIYPCAGLGTGAAPPTVNTARVVGGHLPNPDVAPDIQRVNSTGAFAAGRDVYVLQTYRNSAGETQAGPASSIINTVLNDAVEVTITEPEGDQQQALYTITDIGIYEADVPTGTPAPDSIVFRLVGYFAVGSTATITTTAVGDYPPLTNTTGVAGDIQADSSTGGINGTQGYRYMALMFMNQNYTVSGFTDASVLKYDVDEDGWELGVFRVAPGPGYTLARLCAFSIADGSQAGGFWWIGNVNLQVPAANFVYPQTIESDGTIQSATVFQDNVTTSGTFNFTDKYLEASNNVTDRLDVIWPNQAVHVAYHPSVDRIFQAGVPGYYSGWWVSLAADPESYYADTSYISVGSDDGERSWGSIEYRGTVYGLRERSGFTLSANPANPQQWAATKRWSQVGPCGPRAFDACGMFMIFVHRSGIYRYVDTTPDLMTKEIPYWWRTINWLYAHTICVKIDHEKHEVHILVPVGDSTVPNQEVVLSYLEGWQDPIHFSIYSGREISMDACRKYSINDIQAWVCGRLERNIDQNYPYPQGDSSIPFFDSTFAVTQFCYGSSGPDGTVQAITPGIFQDNDAGIDCVYETVCPQQTLALVKIEGFSLNARGNGTLFPYFLAGRQMVTGQGQAGPIKSNILPCRPIDLKVDEDQGMSRMVPSKINERWRMRFTNGKVKGSWFSLKWLAIYQIPFALARPESQQGG